MSSSANSMTGGSGGSLIMESNAILLLRRFLPSRVLLGDPVEYRRYIFLAGSLLATICCAIPFMLVILIYQGLSPNLWLFATGVPILLATLMYVKHSQNLQRPAIIMTGVMLVFLAALSYFNCGIHAASVFWNIPIPIIASYLISKRAAAISIIFIVLELGIFYVAELNGYPFPRSLPDALMLWFDAAGLAVLTVLLAGLSWLYEESIAAARASENFALRKLAEKNSEYRNLVETSSDAIILVRKNRVVYANPAGAKFLNMQLDAKGLRSRLSSVVVPHDYKNLERELKSVLADIGSTKNVEFSIRGANEKIRTLQGTVSAVMHTSIATIQFSLRDVTDSRRLEKFKREVVTVVSHELRTPISAIISMAEQLADSKLDKPQTEKIEQVSHAAENLLLLTDGILAHSNLESKAMKSSSNAFDLNDFLNKIEKQTRRRCGAANLRFKLYRDPLLPRWVSGFQLGIQIIINNLIDNAIKFSSTGVIVFEVIYRADEAPDLVEFSVTDHGVGIAESDRNIIFEAFTQADSSDARRYPGIGLGLSTSMQFAQMMQSEIKLDSKPGKGSRFWFKTKLQESSAAEVRKDKDIPVMAQPGVKWFGRALVVEDNAISREVADNYLRQLGFEVTLATNGIEALDAIGKEDFRVILMDCQMPHMDGFQATEKIRSSARASSKSAIIGFTAHTEHSYQERCLAAGMDEVIVKPLRLAELRKNIARWLEPDTVELRSAIAKIGKTGKFKHLDSSVLEEIKAENADNTLMNDLVAIYLQETPQRITEMRAALEKGDVTTVKQIAHLMKGSASCFGALRLCNLLVQMEEIGRESHEEVADGYFREMQQENESVSAELRTLVTQEIENKMVMQ